MNQSNNLTLLSYQVTKLAMNEEAFSGKYADFDEEGTYVDITNNEELFSSKDKIKNDSGYACFTKPINPDAITSLRDFSYGMVRLEIRAQKSGIHLGYKKRDYYEITVLDRQYLILKIHHCFYQNQHLQIIKPLFFHLKT